MKKTNVSRTTLNLCVAALIAALYVALTHLAAVMGLSSQVIQCRFSEALCVLVCFTPAAIPGMTIGCLIANITTGAIPTDIIFGSIATFIGVAIGYKIRKHKWLVPLPTVIANTVIVPFVLKYAYKLDDALWFMFLTVCIGEILSAWILGAILLAALSRVKIFEKLK